MILIIMILALMILALMILALMIFIRRIIGEGGFRLDGGGGYVAPTTARKGQKGTRCQNKKQETPKNTHSSTVTALRR